MGTASTPSIPPIAAPAPSPPPAPPPTGSAWWVLPSAQAVTLALAVASFVVCAAKLIAFVSAAPPALAPAVPAPEWSEKKEDQAKYNHYLQTEAQRQNARSQEVFAWTQSRATERAAVLPACGLLLGIGVAFVALTLFIAAVRAESAAPDTASVALGRLVRWTPGVVALICATVIIAVSAPESKPAGPPTGPTFFQPPALQSVVNPTAY